MIKTKLFCHFCLETWKSYRSTAEDGSWAVRLEVWCLTQQCKCIIFQSVMYVFKSSSTKKISWSSGFCLFFVLIQWILFYFTLFYLTLVFCIFPCHFACFISRSYPPTVSHHLFDQLSLSILSPLHQLTHQSVVLLLSVWPAGNVSLVFKSLCLWLLSCQPFYFVLNSLFYRIIPCAFSLYSPLLEKVTMRLWNWLDKDVYALQISEEALPGDINKQHVSHGPSVEASLHVLWPPVWSSAVLFYLLTQLSEHAWVWFNSCMSYS